MLFLQQHEPEPILNWHTVCRQSLAAQRQKVVEQVLRGGTHAPTVPGLTDATLQDIEAYFDATIVELELACVIMLVAAAEAKVRLDARTRWEQHTDQLAKQLKRVFRRARLDEHFVPLYRNDEGILDAWQSFLSNLEQAPMSDVDRAKSAIGSLRNIYSFRNWIAHGRCWDARGGIDLQNYPPTEVANVINRLFAALRSTTALGKIAPF